MEEEKLQQCERCGYGRIVKKYWEEEYKGKKATLILQTVATTLVIMSVIINTILLFKK